MSESLAPLEDQEEQPVTPSRRRKNMPMLRLQSVQEEIRLACLKGNLSSLELLIKGDGKCINELFEDGWSPLMIASNSANPPLVKFLLTMGADPNKCRSDGFSPLMAALTSSKSRILVQQCIQQLMDAGADINCRSDDGLTPLLLAVKDNRVPVVDMLVFNGADVSVKDSNGRSVAQIALERRYDKIVQTLEKHEQDRLQNKLPLTNKRKEDFSDTATISLKEPTDTTESITLQENEIFDSFNLKINLPQDSSCQSKSEEICENINTSDSVQEDCTTIKATPQTFVTEKNLQEDNFDDKISSAVKAPVAEKQNIRVTPASDASPETQSKAGGQEPLDKAVFCGSNGSFIMTTSFAVGIIVIAIGVFVSKFYFQK